MRGKPRHALARTVVLLSKASESHLDFAASRTKVSRAESRGSDNKMALKGSVCTDTHSVAQAMPTLQIRSYRCRMRSTLELVATLVN